ncbi:hypothetical protein HED60_06430 [Planctomycetales bacterium ZRK34]|nr:hypothetical protein HED60_06430 [Planctomycetales bacterium ZRK34]
MTKPTDWIRGLLGNHDMRKQAFTLIERFMVVRIIARLTAILRPSLARAHEPARQAAWFFAFLPAVKSSASVLTKNGAPTHVLLMPIENPFTEKE